MKIKILKPCFSVCKTADFSKVDMRGDYVFIGKTDEENSLVCPETAVPDNITDRDDGWRAFRIEGVLDFSLIGILAEISALLAKNQIGIFAVSTYNTDYIFIKDKSFDKAIKILTENGFEAV